MRRFQKLAPLGVITIVAAILIYWFWPRPIAAEIFPDQTVTIDDVVRRYRLVVPHAISPGPVPLVVAFHGTGDSTELMAAYSKLDRLAAQKGFVLVYPAAARSMWATSNVAPDTLDTNADLQFFDHLSEHLSDQFEIDPNRIYLIGMSNGASFAQLVASARPAVAAVVAHSGAKPRELHQSPNSFPVLLVVGTEDPIATAIRSTAAKYREDGHAAQIISVPGIGHEWSTEHNSIMWEFLTRHARDR